MITKCLLKWKLTCSGWWGSVWRVASHLRSPQVGGMKKNKIFILIKFPGRDLFVEVIKMRYWWSSCIITMSVHLQEGGGDQTNWGLQPATAGGGGGDPCLPGPISPFFVKKNSKLLQKFILITIIIMELRPEPRSLLLVLFSQQLTKSPSLSEFSKFLSSKSAHSWYKSWHQSPEVIPATLWSDVVSGILRPQESLWIIRFAVQEKSLEYYMQSCNANVESMLNPGPHGEPHREPRWVQPSQPRQHDRSSLCWEQLWTRRPYWHHLPACLPGAVLEQLYYINLV